MNKPGVRISHFGEIGLWAWFHQFSSWEIRACQESSCSWMTIEPYHCNNATQRIIHIYIIYTLHISNLQSPELPQPRSAPPVPAAAAQGVLCLVGQELKELTAVALGHHHLGPRFQGQIPWWSWMGAGYWMGHKLGHRWFISMFFRPIIDDRKMIHRLWDASLVVSMVSG